MASHPSLFAELDAALEGLGPPHSVQCSGEWLPSTRRTYENPCQAGTGGGPFVDVVDLYWRGSLTSAAPISCIALLATATELFWGKSLPPSLTQPVTISLHAHAHELRNRATLASSIGGAILPGVPVKHGDAPGRGFDVRAAALATRRVTRLAQVHDVSLFVLAIEGGLIQVGRKRLWHLRAQHAAPLPAHLRELLTRRRTGSIHLRR